MAYNNNIPQPSDTIASSQDPILQNFQAIKQLVDVNHGTFGGTGVNQEGKHKFVEMPNQSADPAGAASEMTLFAKQYTTQTNISEVYVKRDAIAAAVPFTATGNDGGAQPQVNGWYALPCGLIVKFGHFSIAAGDFTTAAIPLTPGPVMTAIYNVQVTPYVGGSALNPQSINFYVATTGVTSFTIKTNSAVAYVVFYQVIGTATF